MKAAASARPKVEAANRTLQKVYDVAQDLSARFAVGAAERDREWIYPKAEIDQLRESGLLSFMVPVEFGGAGGRLVDQLRIPRILADGDSAVAQIFTAHAWMMEWINHAPPHLKEEYFNSRAVDKKDLIWTGVFTDFAAKNVLAYTTTISPDGSGWRLNGTKFYATGSGSATDIFVAANIAGTDQPRMVMIPADAPGVEVSTAAWTGMGQRATASGSITFEDVYVPDDHIINLTELWNDPGNMLPVLAQAQFTAILVGIVANAMRDAAEYVRTKRRPWIHSNVEKATEDPYNLLHIGQMQTWTHASEALFERALDAVGKADRYPSRTSAEARGAAMVAVAEAKALATELGLKVCEMLFQVCGSRATLAECDFDRHWRNLRALSLHDPVEYKLKLVGDYVLNDKLPPVTPFT